VSGGKIANIKEREEEAASSLQKKKKKKTPHPSPSHSSAGKKVHWDGADLVIEELTDAR